MRCRPGRAREGTGEGRGDLNLKRLTSPANPRLKQARRLASSRRRRHEGAVLLEGRRVIRAASSAGVRFELFTADPEDDLADLAVAAFLVEQRILDEIATTVHPQEAVAVAEWTPGAGTPPDARRVAVLCGMSDPGNVGTMIRTAAALGIGAVVMTQRSCDVTNPKVLRASAGAVFSLPVWVEADPDDVFRGLDPGLHHLGAVPAGGEHPAAVLTRCRDGYAVWLGSEAHGLDGKVLDRVDSKVTIPVRDSVESLNVAAAGAILLWELSKA